MARRSARIALVERPIDKPIEKHRRGAREDHADQDEQQNARGRMTIGRDDERTKANGSAKTVCEKRISRRKRVMGCSRSDHFSVSIAVIAEVVRARFRAD